MNSHMGHCSALYSPAKIAVSCAGRNQRGAQASFRRSRSCVSAQQRPLTPNLAALCPGLDSPCKLADKSLQAVRTGCQQQACKA